MALFEGAARAEVAITNAIDGLLAMQILWSRVKHIFAYVPKTHESILLPTLWPFDCFRPICLAIVCLSTPAAPCLLYENALQDQWPAPAYLPF